MSKAPPRPRPGAFTLLEIMLAVAILAIIAGTIYQFTDITLQSARFYSETGDAEAVHSGLRRLVETELSSLPTGVSGALLGLKSRGRDGQRDSLQLVCSPGNGVLAADARGNYEILLEVRESPRRSGKYALGIERRPHDDDDDDDDDEDEEVVQPAKLPRVNLPADWVPLIDGVRTLEIGYFDSRLNGWVEKWTDQATLPNLVRVRYASGVGQEPYEFVARVPAGGVRQPAPTFTALPATAKTPGRPVPGAPVQPLPATRR